MRIFIGILLGWALVSNGGASTPCNRTVTIEHQEVSIETNPRLKGEGLRLYLEKDDRAMHYLERYQERNRIYPFNTFLGDRGAGTAIDRIGSGFGIGAEEYFSHVGCRPGGHQFSGDENIARSE